MRHRLYGKKLGRNKNERTALFRSLTQQLFLHGGITTSEAKAKAIKGMVDKIIHQAKNKNSQRFLQSFFNNQQLTQKVIKEIAPRLSERNSGFTSTLRLRVRPGDQTTLVKLSLIGLDQPQLLEKKVPVKKPQAKKSAKAVPPAKVKPKKSAQKTKAVK